MNNECGFFLPLKTNKFLNIKIEHTLDFKKHGNININGPFFHLENENSMVEFFLHALFNSSIDEAKKFISPDFDDILDLNAVKECFASCRIYKYLSNGNFSFKKKNCFVNPVLFIDKNTGLSSVINFYLINQPDNFSRWKICAIM